MIKAKIFAVKRFEIHDGDGMRTTVFLKGCPLRCKWCHNPESFSAKTQIAYYEDKCSFCGKCLVACKNGAQILKNGKKTIDYEKCTACGDCAKACPTDALKSWGYYAEPQEIFDDVIRDKLFYDSTGGGVTLSGGEPLLQSEFCAELLRMLKSAGVNTAVDTCLCVSPEAVKAVLPYTNTFLVDVKAISPYVHASLTGKSNSVILDNVKMLEGLGADIEFRVPLIVGMNDGEMQDIADFISKIKCKGVKILPYHDYAHGKYRAIGLEAEDGCAVVPSKEQLEAVRQLFVKRGCNVLYE